MVAASLLAVLLVGLAVPPLLLASLLLLTTRLLLLYRLLLGHHFAHQQVCPHLLAAPPWLVALLPWLPLPAPSCSLLLTKLGIASTLSLLATLFLIQAVFLGSRHHLGIWLLFGGFEFVMKIINLFNNIKSFLNHLAWIHQLLALTVAAAVYKSLREAGGRRGDRAVMEEDTPARRGAATVGLRRRAGSSP